MPAVPWCVLRGRAGGWCGLMMRLRIAIDCRCHLYTLLYFRGNLRGHKIDTADSSNRDPHRD